MPKTPFTSLDKLPLILRVPNDGQSAGRSADDVDKIFNTRIYELSPRYRLDMSSCDTTRSIWSVTIRSRTTHYKIKIFNSRTHPYELEMIGNFTHVGLGHIWHQIGFSSDNFNRTMFVTYHRPRINLSITDIPIARNFEMMVGSLPLKVPSNDFISHVDPYLLDMLSLAIDDACSEPISINIYPIDKNNVGVLIDDYIDVIYIRRGARAQKHIDEAVFQYTPEGCHSKQLSYKDMFEVLIQKLLE